jgi:hypothetical protein
VSFSPATMIELERWSSVYSDGTVGGGSFLFDETNEITGLPKNAIC